MSAILRHTILSGSKLYNGGSDSVNRVKRQYMKIFHEENEV